MEKMTSDFLRLRILNPILFLKIMILIIIGISLYSCASLNSTNYQARIIAVNKITDQETLYRITLNDKNSQIRRTAYNKITDQSLINKLAIESIDEDLRLDAINKTTDQNVLCEIAINELWSYMRMPAYNKITDQNFIKRLAIEIKEPLLNIQAVNKITDQKELMSISQNDDNWDVRKEAFKKLNDNSLDVLTREAKNPALVLSSKIRLGRVSWDEAFSGKSSSTETLGHVIGAAAIVDTPQPNTYDVVSACHKFIQLGDASRIPELVFLLNKFGVVSLAEDYMNCGESTLEDAGCKWGRAHGYTCTTGNGSSRVRWGSKK